MGHQIEHQISLGHCQLTQCSCGRSALKVGGKILLLSALELQEVLGLLGAIEKTEKTANPSLPASWTWISGGEKWKDFTAEN